MTTSVMKRRFWSLFYWPRDTVMYFPKFHCEFNSIERVWAQAKRHTRAHCNYSYAGLQKTIGPALDAIDTVLIRKYFQTAQDYTNECI